ncbi:MAG: transposase family protein [Limnohabitans sp.]
MAPLRSFKCAFSAVPCALYSFLIWDAHVGWPGCSGDSTVFKTTALAAQLDGRADSIFLPTDFAIGDQGYALEAQVLTPYGNPTTPAQHYFNYKHSAARRCVEQVRTQELPGPQCSVCARSCRCVLFV